MATRERNVRCKKKTAFQYPQLLHDFSFALGCLGGNAPHAFVANTLSGCLPQREYAMRKHLRSADVLFEPGFLLSRFACARKFFDEHKYTGPFFTSTDATAVRQELTVRLQDDALLGLCTLRAIVAGKWLQDMQASVEKYGIARLVDVFLLNPLDTRIPSFVLGVFPQQSTPKHEVLIKRWSIAYDLLDKHGLCPIAHGGDGDSAQLTAMLTRQQTDEIAFGSGRQIITFGSVPAITGGVFSVTAPSRRVDLPGLGLENIACPVLHFQDPSHLLLKMRHRITGRGGHGVRMGAHGMASARLLAYLLEEESSFRTEIDHGLRKTDLNPKDRMNFPAADRLFGERVIAALQLCPDATAPLLAAPPTSGPAVAPVPPKKRKASKKGNEKSNSEQLPRVVPPRAQELAAFLRLGRDAVFAFLGDGTSYERLHQAWFARYFADGWRAWLQENKLSLADNFLSSNQYACIKLNAESLLLFYDWLCSAPELRRSVPASVFGVGSQQNENLFRTTRAFPDPNFSVAEFLRRLTQVQELSLVASRYENLFVFAAHHKHTRPDHIRRAPVYLDADFSEKCARDCLASALAAAQQLMTLLGMTLASKAPLQQYELSLSLLIFHTHSSYSILETIRAHWLTLMTSSSKLCLRMYRTLS